MSNILVFSGNADFKEDLERQISRFISESKFVEKSPDIIIIDEDVNVFKQKRHEYPTVPLIFLSQISDIMGDKLNILIKKPFSLMLLLDTIRAANNKLDNSKEGFLVFNNYELRPNAREIKDLLTGEVTKLTEKEVYILKYLYKSSDRYVVKNDLQKDVWKYNEDVTTHTIETHIYRLRQKVEKDNGRRLIITDNGGYKLNVD